MAPSAVPILCCGGAFCSHRRTNSWNHKLTAMGMSNPPAIVSKAWQYLGDNTIGVFPHPAGSSLVLF